MLAQKQINRLLDKLKRFEAIIVPLLFDKVADLQMGKFETNQRLHTVPEEDYENVRTGSKWGGEGRYCWFRGKLNITPELAGKPLYIRPEAGGVEAMLWVNGFPSGIFTKKEGIGTLGHHYCDLLKSDPAAGDTIDVAIEAYAGHYIMGSQPFMENPKSDFLYEFKGVDICVKNVRLFDFYFDLKTFNQMAGSLDPNSYVRANIVNTLIRVHEVLYCSPEDADREQFLSAVEQAGKLLKKLFEYKNTTLAPTAAVIGHSHMDTAWHWPIAETVKKCARTYANQISLMKQYPEYRFVQSSAYHSDMIRKNYPALFAEIQEAVKDGRYEPNGGVWVECDCNMVNGEMMIRQFLWGQRFTEKYFGYRSNCFWLPDTFGYSASIPQIMKGCGVDYFLTTKIAWNDTNSFPYDTFYWQGLDGTKVLAHFNKTHLWPDPETCIDLVVDGRRSQDSVKEKNVASMRLLAYGHGDGGGGPQFEMIEMARRCEDIEGCPKVKTMPVGDFMKQLEDSLVSPSTYAGELYLEIHRGTLTNQHTIKRNNRLAETAIHDLEYRVVREAAVQGAACASDETRELVETLLVNQFHDILPGTCIPVVHDQSIAETSGLIKKAESLIRQKTAAIAVNDGRFQSIVNTLPFTRSDTVYFDLDGDHLDGIQKQQMLTDLDGNKKLAAAGFRVGSFAAEAFKVVPGKPEGHSAFRFDGKCLEAPLYIIVFNDRMYLESLVDKTMNRELRGEGYALNTLLLAEDVPLAWDNWDIDADIDAKFRDCAVLLDSCVVSDGPVEFRLRNTYRLTDNTTLTQDVVCCADRKQISFATRINWQDNHRLLKTAFDTNVFSDFVRQEVQFGYVKRPTTRNNDIEKAKFEVCNHKYTSLAENRYGVALLNDCKYGISAKDGQLRLTLHKGGNRPDYRGDKGLHDFTYSFVFHEGGFDAQNVIQPAYELNVKPIVTEGFRYEKSFMQVDRDNIIIETLKPCENDQRSFIARLYEAEGTYTNTVLRLAGDAFSIELTNMLEETIEILQQVNTVQLTFRPFEIKTLKITYA